MEICVPRCEEEKPIPSVRHAMVWTSARWWRDNQMRHASRAVSEREEDGIDQAVEKRMFGGERFAVWWTVHVADTGAWKRG